MARPRPTEVDTAQLSGRLDRAFPPLAALQVCHVAEMTGILRAHSGPRFVKVSFCAGEVVAAASVEGSGLEALVEFGRWSEGRFDFVCGPPPRRNGLRAPFAGLMLAICQQLDESRPPRVLSPTQKNGAGPEARAAYESGPTSRS